MLFVKGGGVFNAFASCTRRSGSKLFAIFKFYAHPRAVFLIFRLAFSKTWFYGSRNMRRMAWYYTSWSCINSIPNDKVPAWSKLKVFADVKIKLAKMRKLSLIWLKTLWENAVNQHFLLFPQCFQRAYYVRSLKVDCLVKELSPFLTD